jgi:hypothetical protein
MKSDEDVRMISAEAPVLFAKACELFVSELTLKAWLHAECAQRRTLLLGDIAAVVHSTDTLDFLVRRSLPGGGGPGAGARGRGPGGGGPGPGGRA